MAVEATCVATQCGWCCTDKMNTIAVHLHMRACRTSNQFCWVGNVIQLDQLYNACTLLIQASGKCNKYVYFKGSGCYICTRAHFRHIIFKGQSIASHHSSNSEIPLDQKTKLSTYWFVLKGFRTDTIHIKLEETVIFMTTHSFTQMTFFCPPTLRVHFK